ncbi:MAG: hypothetical protein O7A63_09000 [Acidobacteria bacterium]|nr:hypothetical protein [Acidobacteriota bacterium]
MPEDPTEALGQGGAEVALKGLDSAEAQYLRDRLSSEQNLGAAGLGGVAAALLGAVLWAAITVVTNYQIGFMAIGVGMLVGYVVRTFGKGVDKPFGFIGGVLTLAGCALGDLLTACALVARQYDVSILKILGGLDLEMAGELMTTYFGPMDLLFYGLAVWEGYKLSFRKLSQEDLQRMLGGENAAPPASTARLR